MKSEYYLLNDCGEISNPNDLNLERAKSLLMALRQQRDYSIVRLLRHVSGKAEFIIVDVECDGVPPNNAPGIKYRERLALGVPDNPRQLVEVLALRKDFPVIIHQNQAPKDTPRSLCLYFEPPATVLRTWTPQRFLRRIQGWLEKSARSELHPADQPVEQLFFMTRYELVLPWNFEEIRKAKDQLMIVRGPERPGGGITCFIEASPRDGMPRKGVTRHVEFTLPPIVHGHIECDPATFGELADVFTERGVDILPALKRMLSEGIDENGVQADVDDTVTVILIHIPVTRAVDSPPERSFEKAFIVLSGPVKLGIATGALFSLPGQVGTMKKYYRADGLIDAQPLTGWRSEKIYSMEVLRQNDAAAARLQSGVSGEGPAGVLVGAGSLGSTLLQIWGRSGWGYWTIIDKDHIKPHNLSRYPVYAQHIGQGKTAVMAELHDATMQGATKVIPLNADACDLTQEGVTTALRAAKLIIDASTTLEYPRAISDMDEVGRHISVFITPNGNDSVLLAEDERRRFRLRTLEAQYYRLLIEEAWGQHHLDGNLGSFWSGASCRDISHVMPYSKVLGHASILAEQIQSTSAQSHAIVRVWQRDPERGSIVARDFRPAPELRMKFGKFELFMDTGIEQQLRALRAARLPDETGGVLLGYYDFNRSSVTVITALSAPPDSDSSPTSFERGTEGLIEAVREASRRTANIVEYIGEWHSHPQNHSASPSQADLFQLLELAHAMAEDGLPAVQLIVGEHDVQILQGTMKG